MYWVFRVIVILVLKLFFRFEVEGLENLPKKTNFIVVANHTSFLDPAIIGAAIPQKIYWVTLRNIYRLTWLRWLMSITEAMPTGSAAERLVYLLNRNKNVGLFPEGRRSFDGKLGDFRRGAALLAIKTGRPIVPCAILGAYTALPRTRKFPRLFVPIKLKIGQPRYLLREFEEVIDDIYLQEGIFKIRNTIKEMLDAG
ncbi:MAG: 1-acyl-sn-glycerol-3-phosphate acyltransferase [Candidatus Omnitrophica bacterium]|nr:1-acyl-sn-glycerol-3-phosphate acyltransferase [Candidatus Omnitrophota bacterium]